MRNRNRCATVFRVNSILALFCAPRGVPLILSIFSVISSNLLMFSILGVNFFSLAPLSVFAQAPIIQPGAPGAEIQLLSAVEAVKITDTSFSADDVIFMQQMIPHHQQALELTQLVESRTNQPELIDIAARITASQSDEIEFMSLWLTEREARSDFNHHEPMSDRTMRGMVSPEQIVRLAELKGVNFDRLFLDLMIQHHEGAVDMVELLLDQPGSAYDPLLFEFVNDLKNDQMVEVERMHSLMVTLSADPRANLKPGIVDAGIAIHNLTLIATLKKPPGFVDPNNPTELSIGPVVRGADKPEDKPVEGGDSKRSPLLSFSNTDMAFSGDILVVGSYHGFNIYSLANGGIPEHLSSVVCPGGQGDVSIVGNLLLMSVEETRGRLDCGLEGISKDISEDRFRGLRIFDISDVSRPVQIAAIQTCRGSHTHSVVSKSDVKGNIIVYNSGTSGIREQEEMDSCFDESPGDTRTALFRIDVIQIPIDNPSDAKIIDSPAVFADEKTGILAGLWRGGDHGVNSQETARTDECHDITVYPTKNLAAGACSGNGILFDISDPLKPSRIDVVTDPGFAYWHSATFNNDGTKVIFTDEWGGGRRPRCRAFDPREWGADAIYDIVDGKMVFKGYFKIPAPQIEQENCVAHNGSIIPVPGRDIFVQAWYQGGLSVIDFTDSEHPFEIAYFDRGPIDGEALVTGGFWSTYWYREHIYGSEIVRGLDIFKLKPSEQLSFSEIQAAEIANQGEVFNPQQQFPVTWPNHPRVALAYIDQLARTNPNDYELWLEARDLLIQALAVLERGDSNAAVSEALASLSVSLGYYKSDAEKLIFLLDKLAMRLASPNIVSSD